VTLFKACFANLLEFGTENWVAKENVKWAVEIGFFFMRSKAVET
jgi:hypothetical protein